MLSRDWMFMIPDLIDDTLAKQTWVEPADKAMSGLAEATIGRAGKAIRNFLHGTWLGHPLHPVVTDVPIGAFTVAATLDLLDTLNDTDEYEAGADAAVAIGLVSASLAAASGLADWSKSSGAGRRVGVLHAALNGGATLLYLASWLLRKNDRREAGVGTGLLGYAMLGAGAYLGGHMVYNNKLGVDHSVRGGPEEFTAVLPESELPENTSHRVELDGVPILIVRQHGRFTAIGDVCAHLGGPLSEGKLEDGAVVCPRHGSKYCLATGQVLEGPSAYPQTSYETRVHNGQIELRLLKKN